MSGHIAHLKINHYGRRTTTLSYHTVLLTLRTQGNTRKSPLPTIELIERPALLHSCHHLAPTRPATAATSLANLPARLLLARPETAAIMHRTRASHACAAPPVGPPPARGDARHAGEGVVGTSASASANRHLRPASARRCRWAASASRAWVVAWLAASSLPSPVAALVDNVAGNVGHHRHRGLEDTSRWGWDLSTSKRGRM